ncbi:unnamed protein product [Brassica oleracea var. botrytis]
MESVNKVTSGGRRSRSPAMEDQKIMDEVHSSLSLPVEKVTTETEAPSKTVGVTLEDPMVKSITLGDSDGGIRSEEESNGLNPSIGWKHEHKDSEQGEWIAEYANWFAPGSRVILITQDKSVLEESGVNHVYVYEVGSLRYDEALQLFSRFAFKQPYPPPEFERLSVRAVQLAGFLPMAIRLFGSFLTGKSKEEWGATLLKLNAKQSKEAVEVWKIMEASEDEHIVESSSQR